MFKLNDTDRAWFQPVLIPVSQIEPIIVRIHCFEQSLTTSGTAAFALAAYRLRQLLRSEANAAGSNQQLEPIATGR